MSTSIHDLKLYTLAEKRGSGHTPPIFLEGPTTDIQGNLFVVDVGQGRILRYQIASSTWDLVVDYDGEPNGLTLDREGQLLIADYKNGIVRRACSWDLTTHRVACLRSENKASQATSQSEEHGEVQGAQ